MRERLATLIGGTFAMGFVVVLLPAVGAPPAATLLLCLVLLLCYALPLVAEYVPKRVFYGRVTKTLEGLEAKYLLSELLQEPDFFEGAFFYRAMVDVNKAMNDHVSTAQRDMREYREYIESWVHEIKTPIASARLLLENQPGPGAEHFGEELFRIDGYVEQALFYARSGSVERDYLVRQMPLRDAVTAAIRKYARPLIEAGVQIDVGELNAMVYSDPKWVEFILGQLISNAVKYRGKAPKISFAQREEESKVVLTVVDNGVGIPLADLPRVFNKGFTGCNGRGSASHATGLGLYLCKKLCICLGLSIRAESTSGEGTQITLTFPRSQFYMVDGEGAT